MIPIILVLYNLLHFFHQVMNFYDPSTFLKVLGKTPLHMVPTLLRCIWWWHIAICYWICALQPWCRSHEIEDIVYIGCFYKDMCVSIYMHSYLYTLYIMYELGPMQRCKSGRKNICKSQWAWAFLRGNYWYHSFLLCFIVVICIYVNVLVAIYGTEYVKLPSSSVLCTNNIEYTIVVMFHPRLVVFFKGSNISPQIFLSHKLGVTKWMDCMIMGGSKQFISLFFRII